MEFFSQVAEFWSVQPSVTPTYVRECAGLAAVARWEASSNRALSV